MIEHKYPIYEFRVEMSNSDHNVCTTRMFQEHLTVEQVNQHLQEFIDTNLNAERLGVDGPYRICDLGLDIVSCGWRFVREESWCCDWFSHYTFNTHLTDDELLASFQAYVDRHLAEQPGECESIEDHRKRVGGDWVCLMGAGDRWRWRGPCRCEHCTARGIVRIDH